MIKYAQQVLCVIMAISFCYTTVVTARLVQDPTNTGWVGQQGPDFFTGITERPLLQARRGGLAPPVDPVTDAAITIRDLIISSRNTAQISYLINTVLNQLPDNVPIQEQIIQKVLCWLVLSFNVHEPRPLGHLLNACYANNLLSPEFINQILLFFAQQPGLWQAAEGDDQEGAPQLAWPLLNAFLLHPLVRPQINQESIKGFFLCCFESNNQNYIAFAQQLINYLPNGEFKTMMQEALAFCYADEVLNS